MTMPPPASASPPPVLSLDRRGLFRAGLLGAGLAALPVAAAAAQERGFTHGVASGEPGANSVLLWTRFASADPVKLRYEVSDSMDFAKVAAGGDVEATPARDGCVKPVAAGLAPDRWYYFRFIAPDGSMSDIGRTRTLPMGDTSRFRMAVVGCSNIGFGWFNAYAHIAAADAFDLVVHTGDYIYEYGAGTYPAEGEAVAGRTLVPQTEIIALADYRLRYAAYRADPDLQRLHQLYPMIAVWDDHETANDSYRDGAENHDPATEGTWDMRKRVAMQAYHEWMPVSDAPWAAYEIGNLATLFRLETRLTARTKPFDLTTIIARGGDNPAAMMAALDAFRDGEWRDENRTLMGAAQEAWLADGMARSRKAGKTWQVLAQQVIMASLSLPKGIADNLSDGMPAYIRKRLLAAAATSRAGLPFNMDAWDGYPAARARLLKSAQEADANLIVLAGDSHNGWASQLDHDGAPAGVEFAGHSVTSPGAEGYLPWIKPADFAAQSVARNPQLQWANTGQRGYMAVELTPASATSEYRFVSGVKTRSATLAGAQRISTKAGSARLDIG